MANRPPARGRVRKGRAGFVKKTVAYCIIAFWVFMVALFVRREIIPALYAPSARGYAGIRAYAQGHTGYRMGVTTAAGKRVGSTQTVYQIMDNGDCEIRSDAAIDFGTYRDLPPGPDELSTARRWTQLVTHSEVTIGPDNALKKFWIDCDTGPISAHMRGVVEGESLRATIRIAGVENEIVIPITKDDVISSGIMALGALPELHTGQTWRMRMFSLSSFRFTDAYVTVKKKTKILLRGHWYTVHEVETRHSMGKVTTWVDESGSVLREQALNLVFTREPLPHEMSGRPGEALSPPARAIPRKR